VFRPGERPWILLERAGAGEVARVIECCPTGALQYTRRDGAPNEAPPAANTVLVARDGPTYLRGRIELRTPGGELLLADTRVAICRCGRSRHKPLCDNTHREAGFRDEGALADPESVQDPGAEGPVLRVIVHPDGPVQLDGPFAISSADGRTILTGTSTWLCRCGQSGSKPFCDGSHERTGYRSE
jgi:CDGSH-type Zn-finger protein